MPEQVRYLPRDNYTAMPWRNGAGVTQEIVRAPARGEPFAWRLSLATVAASGPFSAYPGYRRAVALVDGSGFRLDINNLRSQTLRERGEHAVFAGADATECTLLAGPCTDLSLMVREPGDIRSVSCLQIGDDVTVTVPAGVLQILFVLHGRIACREFSSDPTRTSSSDPYALNLNDTLLIEDGPASWLLSQAEHAANKVLAMSFAVR